MPFFFSVSQRPSGEDPGCVAPNRTSAHSAADRLIKKAPITYAALNANPDRLHLADLPGFDRPAASRYAPKLLRWFNSHNEGRNYPDQVRPFNFLTVFPARVIPSWDWGGRVESQVGGKRTSGRQEIFS
jgi:hypothetical protein